MATNTTDTPMVQRIRQIVEPIASDLGLDLYDVEQRGGTMRITLDTPAGGPAGVDLDQLALATRLVSRELDHQDPIPGQYTLEVTSPGVERTLRTPAHFQREIGKTINVRLANVEAEQRRFEGVLVAADHATATIRVGDGVDAIDQVVDIDSIDRARTVFVWGPQPKPGGKGAKKPGSGKPGATRSASTKTPSGKTLAESKKLAGEKLADSKKLAGEKLADSKKLAGEKLADSKKLASEKLAAKKSSGKKSSGGQPAQDPENKEPS